MHWCIIFLKPYSAIKVTIVLLSVCYITALLRELAAKARFKPSTFQTKGVESTNELTCPTLLYRQYFHCIVICLLRHFSVLSSTVFSSVFYVTMLSIQSFHCFVICLLRHCSVLGSTVSSYVCNVTRLSLHRFIICLLRHCSILSFDCLFLCLLRT